MMRLHNNRHSLSWVLMWMFSSVILVSGSILLGRFYYLHIHNQRLNDDAYNIAAIVQTGSVKNALPTVYLAEVIGLSVDKRINIYQFDTIEARKNLIASPVIKDADVIAIPPETVYVDYTVREPVAYLADYDNAAIDEEGVMFPVSPFFTPKRIPEVYIGIADEELPWESKIEDIRLDIMFDIIKKLSSVENFFEVVRIDVSQAYADSYGKRQIAVFLNDCDKERVLRLSTRNYAQELGNYIVLSDAIRKRGDAVIDMRISQLAFILD